eukprot:COSAG05_NODE_1915_length_3839_cov_1.596524_2_plen_782_part_00
MHVVVDPNAINYNPAANSDSKNCIFYAAAPPPPPPPPQPVQPDEPEPDNSNLIEPEPEKQSGQDSQVGSEVPGGAVPTPQCSNGKQSASAPTTLTAVMTSSLMNAVVTIGIDEELSTLDNLTSKIGCQSMFSHIVRTNSASGSAQNLDAEYLLAGSSCQLLRKVNSNVISIVFQNGDQLLPGDRIVLMPCKFWSEKDDRVYWGSAILRPPPNAYPPTAVIIGPNQLGPCAQGIHLDGSLSAGSGGNTFPLAVEWSCDYSGRHGEPLISALQDASAQNSLYVSLPTLHDEMMGVAINFQLTITDQILQLSDTTTHRVQTSVHDTPLVSIRGPPTMEILCTAPTDISASATLPQCNSGVGSLAFRWTVSQQNSTFSPLSELVASERSSMLHIPAHHIAPGGDSIFRVIVMLKSNPSSSSTARVALRCVAEPLVVLIKGGSRVVGYDEQFVLDGSDSRDPADSGAVLAYQWECTTLTGSKCTLAVSQTPTWAVNARQLQRGSTYIFTLRVSMEHGGALNTGDASVSIKVSEGKPPGVSITAKNRLREKYNVNERIILEGTVTPTVGVGETQQAWESVQRDGCTYLPLTASTILSDIRSPNLVIGEYILQPTDMYCFRLVANDQFGYGFAETILEVNGSPSGGSISSQPVTGAALVTEFHIFINESFFDEDRPLAYRFGYGSGQQMARYLTDFQPIPEVRTYLPPGLEEEKSEVFVQVADVYGSRNSAQTIVKVSPFDPAVENMDSLASSLLSGARAEGNLQKSGQLVRFLFEYVYCANCCRYIR